MKILKEILFSVVVMLITLATIFSGIVLFEQYGRREEEKQAETVRKLIEQELAPLRARISELEKRPR